MDIIEEGFKRCSKCNRVLPITDFNKQKKAKDGLKSYCRQCDKAMHAEYYQSNKDAILQKNADYYQANKDKKKAYNADYYQANKDKKKAYNADYYQANKDKKKAYNAEYRAENKYKIAQKKADYYSKNKERFTDYYNTQTHPLNWAKRMVKAYRQMDRERFGDDSKTITAEWFVQNIMYKPCAHCGLLQVGAIGANRLNNNIGHEASNLEPCCRNCNSRLGAIYQIERGTHISQIRKKQSFSSFVDEHKKD